MSDLPVGWAEARLADVAEVRLGRQRSPSRATGERMRPYLRAANVNWSGLALADVKEMAFTEAESKVYELQPGDILLGEASGSPAEVGKPGQYKGEIAGCCFQNTLLRVRVPKELDSDFYELFFRKEALTGRFAAGSRGVGIHHLGAAALTNWTVPVPPRAEQERIVTAIDEAFSKLDAGEAALRAARQRLKRLRESVLSAAVTGRLVPQDLTDEPSSKLLADVGVIPADDGGGFAVPSGWAVSRVGDVADVDLGRQRHPDWHDGPNMKPYLRVANVFEDRIDTRDVKQMHFDADAFERFKLVVGDVLLNEGQTPELLGRPAIYRGEPPEVAFTNSILRFKAKAGINPEWALLVFRHYMRTGRFTRESRITTNIAHLSAGRLKPIEFPVPPTNEQRRIVMKVEHQFSFIDACERTIGVGLARSAALRRSILKSAFEGRLVPQDPTDEHAAALLDRTRAERDAAGKARKPGRTSKAASST